MVHIYCGQIPMCTMFLPDGLATLAALSLLV